MFPGGVNPNVIRQMQERVDLAGRYYEGVGEIMRRNEISRHMPDFAWMDKYRERVVRETSLDEIARSLAAIETPHNFAGIQSSLEALNRASELADTRFGSEGLEAARRIFGSRVAPDPTFAAGFERAEKKIREGRAVEVLEEAAALVSGEDTRLTLEQADKDALLDAARLQPEPEDEVPALEIQAGVDIETVIELAELSEEDLDAREYYVGQIIKVLFFVVSVALVVANPHLSLTQASGALGSIMALWGIVNAARAKKREQNKDA